MKELAQVVIIVFLIWLFWQWYTSSGIFASASGCGAFMENPNNASGGLEWTCLGSNGSNQNVLNFGCGCQC